MAWDQCLAAADALIVGHEELAYDQSGILISSKQCPIVVASRERAKRGVCPVNTPDFPVLATACFMARGRDTWSMKPVGSKRGATGLGLVRLIGSYDLHGDPVLAVPTVAVVAITLGVHASLIPCIMEDYQYGRELHLMGATEEDYRQGLGNSQSIPALIKLWNAKPGASVRDWDPSGDAPRWVSPPDAPNEPEEPSASETDASEASSNHEDDNSSLFSSGT